MNLQEVSWGVVSGSIQMERKGRKQDCSGLWCRTGDPHIEPRGVLKLYLALVGGEEGSYISVVTIMVCKLLSRKESDIGQWASSAKAIGEGEVTAGRWGNKVWSWREIRRAHHSAQAQGGTFIPLVTIRSSNKIRGVIHKPSRGAKTGLTAWKYTFLYLVQTKFQWQMDWLVRRSGASVANIWDIPFD